MNRICLERLPEGRSKTAENAESAAAGDAAIGPIAEDAVRRVEAYLLAVGLGARDIRTFVGESLVRSTRARPLAELIDAVVAAYQPKRRIPAMPRAGRRRTMAAQDLTPVSWRRCLARPRPSLEPLAQR